MATRLIPRTFQGSLALLAGIAALVVVVFTATTGGLILGLLLIAIGAYLLWVLGYRVDRFLRKSPLFGGDK